MSSIEYMDMFVKCQSNDNALYHVFTFDLVNSKGLTSEELCYAEYTLLHIIIELRNVLKKYEKETDTKVLVFENGFSNFEDNKSPDEFGLKVEPFKLGDMVGFTIYRDSMSKYDILSLFESIKLKYNFNYPVHISNGYYETNNYYEGNTKLFRGYAIDILSNIHKDNYQRLLRI